MNFVNSFYKTLNMNDPALGSETPRFGVVQVGGSSVGAEAQVAACCAKTTAQQIASGCKCSRVEIPLTDSADSIERGLAGIKFQAAPTTDLTYGMRLCQSMLATQRNDTKGEVVDRFVIALTDGWTNRYFDDDDHTKTVRACNFKSDTACQVAMQAQLTRRANAIRAAGIEMWFVGVGADGADSNGYPLRLDAVMTPIADRFFVARSLRQLGEIASQGIPSM